MLKFHVATRQTQLVWVPVPGKEREMWKLLAGTNVESPLPLIIQKHHSSLPSPDVQRLPVLSHLVAMFCEFQYSLVCIRKSDGLLMSGTEAAVIIVIFIAWFESESLRV